MVLIYIAATIYGGAVRPGYSHIRDSVSELVEVDAPKKSLLDSIFVLYHLLFFSFAYALQSALPGIRWRSLAPALLALTGCLGLVLTIFFPCDVGCEENPTTITGKGHAVIVTLSALCVFIAMLAVSWQARRDPAWHTYARFTLICALSAIGLSLAAIAYLNSAYTGLAERLSLAPIFLWFIASGFQLWRATINQSAKE